MAAVGALGLVLTAALVTEEGAALRAAPSESAAHKAQLSRGDWLEVRGERGTFLQVYDHRRERPGYVRADKVRAYPVAESSAPALKAVVDFLRDTPGAESLGIGYLALYMKVAPKEEAVAGETLDALGSLADRLARRASLRRSGPGAAQAAAVLAAQLDVAESYGLRFQHIEREGGEGGAVVCYEGDAYRRVLALPGPGNLPAARARAALGLTRAACQDGRVGVTEKQAQDEWRLSVLERAAPGPGMPAHLQNLVRLRRAEVLSGLAFQHARRGEAAQAAARGEAAVRELALVSRPDLGDGDEGLYEEVAVRVAAARWAAEPAGKAGIKARGVTLKMEPGQPGETCVSFLGQKGNAGNAAQVLQRRCTYGLAWGASLLAAPRGGVAALAVQQLPGWVELWVLRPPVAGAAGEGGAAGPEGPEGNAGWRLDVLPPAPADPDLGYAEVAGFSPDGGRMLVVREARVGGAVRRSFQVLRTDTLEVERQARNPELLAAYRSWAAPSWKQRTLALR